MAKWRIKEISDLTKVSVRMLHHYDKIGLLKPSMRTPNDYRWYSEQDLEKLQQIIALKFFGFSLSQIKTMLQEKLTVGQSLNAQQQMLQNQVESLRLALDTLDDVLERYKVSKSLDWKHLIELIERYRMAEEIKSTWAGKLNEKQQDKYLEFRKKYLKECEAWEKAAESINSLKLGDPEGPEGQKIANIFMEFLRATTYSKNNEYTREYSKQSNSDILGEIKEFKNKNIPLSPEGNAWFAKAIGAYWLRRWESLYQDIDKNLNADPEGTIGKKIAQQWRELVNEQIAGAPVELHLGMMLWQELQNAKTALQDKKAAPDNLQKQSNKTWIKLYSNPNALSWITRAFNAH